MTSLKQRIVSLENGCSEISQAQLDTKQDVLIAGDNITITDNIISSTGGASTVIQPRFMAYRTTDNTFYSPTDVIYNVIKYNVGGGTYNTITGKYTVPVAGLYMFTAVWHSVGGQTIEANFQKNDVIMSRCQLGTALSNFTQNNISFIECVVGDVINIRLVSGRLRIIYSVGFNVPQGYTQFTGLKVAD